ncbi:hypothetical protein E2C01_045641 [Portunus trituberculatus]|uniref:Uncharacterized protein n=1 Tax=Portunus trituberculatus TaxID=210409 RepID=A0A5B7G2K8_PORTR|nr:hypothetical protein [Portunus trituberculatus]
MFVNLTLVATPDQPGRPTRPDKPSRRADQWCQGSLVVNINNIQNYEKSLERGAPDKANNDYN